MKYAQQSDVLLHEVFIEGEILQTNKMRTKKTLHNVKSYHTTSSEVGKVWVCMSINKDLHASPPKESKITLYIFDLFFYFL